MPLTFNSFGFSIVPVAGQPVEHGAGADLVADESLAVDVGLVADGNLAVGADLAVDEVPAADAGLAAGVCPSDVAAQAVS